MGKRAYPAAEELFITADAGGSNGYRSHAWKHQLQKFADEAKLDKRTYPTGVKIPAAEMKALSLHHLDFQGEWNYELHPRTPSRPLHV